MRDDPRLSGLILLAVAAISCAAIVYGLAPLFALAPPPPSPTALALMSAGFALLLYGLIAAVGIAGILIAKNGTGLLGARAGRWAGTGAGMGFAGLLLVAGYARLADTLHGAPAPATGGSAALLLLGTVSVVIQSAAEEIFFRGWLQRELRRLWGAWPALLAAALLFAILHLMGGARAPLSLLNLTLGGLLFGLLAERSGGLAAPIAAHIGWNWAEIMLLGLDPNPGVSEYGALFDFDLSGAALWGGSSEGLNASIAATFVLAALIAPLVLSPGLLFSRRPARG